MPKNEDEKINHIEETLAHQEQQIQDLSDIATRQSNEIDALKNALSKMKDKIGVLEDAGHSSDDAGLSVTEIAARDKPPHY